MLTPKIQFLKRDGMQKENTILLVLWSDKKLFIEKYLIKCFNGNTDWNYYIFPFIFRIFKFVQDVFLVRFSNSVQKTKTKKETNGKVFVFKKSILKFKIFPL